MTIKMLAIIKIKNALEAIMKILLYIVKQSQVKIYKTNLAEKAEELMAKNLTTNYKQETVKIRQRTAY